MPESDKNIDLRTIVTKNEPLSPEKTPEILLHANELLNTLFKHQSKICEYQLGDINKNSDILNREH